MITQHDKDLAEHEIAMEGRPMLVGQLAYVDRADVPWFIIIKGQLKGERMTMQNVAHRGFRLEVVC